MDALFYSMTTGSMVDNSGSSNIQGVEAGGLPVFKDSLNYTVRLYLLISSSLLLLRLFIYYKTTTTKDSVTAHN